MNRFKVKGERLKVKGIFWFLSVFIFQFSFSSCNPDAHWEASNVEIFMDIRTVSAGFIECQFSTNKDAYYLIAVEEVQEDYDPMAHQKQFMMLALDSANKEYIIWRNRLLREGEFNIAPFASHVLQYGTVEHFFTGLIPGQDYWVYAFVVNPEKLTPAGKLYITRVTTKMESIVDVHFDYRVNGYWDYVYPLDKNNDIYARFPYVATTRDSLEIAAQEVSPEIYFSSWLLDLLTDNLKANLLYGVKAVNNDGINSHLKFEAGHTYFTAIAGYDGAWGDNVIYKFHWEGEQTSYYFTNEDQYYSDGEDE